MTENRLKMDTHFEFFNYDALSDDEVQRIKNLLKEPCKAVKLPKFVFVIDEAAKPVTEFKPTTPPLNSSPSTGSPSRHPSQPRQPHRHPSPVPSASNIPVEYVQLPHSAASHYATMSATPLYTSVTGATYMQAGYTLGTNLYMAAAPKPMDQGGYPGYKMLNGMETAEGMDGSGQGGMVLSPNYGACYYTPCPPPHHQYMFNHGHTFLTPIAPLHPGAGLRGTSASGEVHHSHHHHHHQPQQPTSVPPPYMTMPVPVPPAAGPPTSLLPSMPMVTPSPVLVPSVAASIQLVDSASMVQQSYDVVVDVEGDAGEEGDTAAVTYDVAPSDVALVAEELQEGAVFEGVEDEDEEEEEEDIAYDEGMLEAEPDHATDDGYAEEEHQYADSGVADDGLVATDVEGDEGFLDAAPADEGLDEGLEEGAEEQEDDVVEVAAPMVVVRGDEQVVVVAVAGPVQVETLPVAVAAAPMPEASGPKSWASLFKRQAPSPVRPTPPPASNEPATTTPQQQKQPPPPRSTPQQQPPTSNGFGAATVNAKTTASRAENKGSVTSVKETPKAESSVASALAYPGAKLSNGASSVTNSNDLQQLGEMLIKFQQDNRNISFLPRGLSNKGNWCYISSTLQSLLACPPFYNLLLKLPSISGLKHGKSLTPITDTMIEFINEFPPVSTQKMFQVAPANSRRKEELSFGTPFEPVYIYDMLSRLRLNAFEGRQEDAEEFLSCLLNGLHDEMCAALTSVGSKEAPLNGNLEEDAMAGLSDEVLPEENSDDSWQVMEKRNKASITRTTNFNTSPVSEIFCGKIRSALHSGSRSSATLQPFFTLQLDIQSDNVRSVRDAMQGLVVKESLQGYHCSKTKQEVTASRQMTLEELPPVLILHLKRFIYKDGGSMKLSKRVDFGIELELNKELLSPTVKARITGRQRIYRLVAVVYHCGGEAGKGHYVSDVFHHGSSTWLRADDARLACISENKVLHHPVNCIPYLLFYRRSDTIAQPQPYAAGANIK